MNAPVVNLEPLVTASQFRKLLAVSDRTFRRWLSCGIVPRPDVVLGSAKRWHAETVRRVMDLNGQREVGPRLAAVGT